MSSAAPRKKLGGPFPSTAIYRHASRAWDAPAPSRTQPRRSLAAGLAGAVGEKRVLAFLINLLCELGATHTPSLDLRCSSAFELYVV